MLRLVDDGDFRAFFVIQQHIDIDQAFPKLHQIVIVGSWNV